MIEKGDLRVPYEEDARERIGIGRSVSGGECMQNAEIPGHIPTAAEAKTSCGKKGRRTTPGACEGAGRSRSLDRVKCPREAVETDIAANLRVDEPGAYGCPGWAGKLR